MGGHLITDPFWVGPWVAQRIGGTHRVGHTATIGLSPDGLGLTAGVIYEDWNGRSIVAHVAIEGRITRAFIAAIFDYPFNTCGAQKIICPIASTNARSIALATHMGFVQEARISDAAPSGDILIYTLTKAECRFLGDKWNGQIRTRAPAPA